MQCNLGENTFKNIPILIFTVELSKQTPDVPPPFLKYQGGKWKKTMQGLKGVQRLVVNEIHRPRPCHGYLALWLLVCDVPLFRSSPRSSMITEPITTSDGFWESWISLTVFQALYACLTHQVLRNEYSWEGVYLWRCHMLNTSLGTRPSHLLLKYFYFVLGVGKRV